MFSKLEQVASRYEEVVCHFNGLISLLIKSNTGP